MFELRSKTKWYWPLESDFIVQIPSSLEFPGPLNPPPPPIPPWNFQFPPWCMWGSGYFLEPAHIVWKYIFYCTYVLNKNEYIVNAGYWVLSENPRNFGCNISVLHPSIQSLGGREGNKVSAYRGVEYVIFSWQEIMQEMAQPFLSSSKTYCLLTNFFSSIS